MSAPTRRSAGIPRGVRETRLPGGARPLLHRTQDAGHMPQLVLHFIRRGDGVGDCLAKDVPEVPPQPVDGHAGRAFAGLHGRGNRAIGYGPAIGREMRLKATELRNLACVGIRPFEPGQRFVQ